MGEIRTLVELQDLGSCDFNQPEPRHGLCLLHWLASEIRINRLKYTPPSYGFHWFNNNNNGVVLLPDENLQYFEVGNLNAEGAEYLPLHVRPMSNNDKYYGKKNMDRIIIGVKNGHIQRVYVTEHEDRSNFRRDRTFQIDQNLLNQISKLNRDNFLSVMQNYRQNRFIQQSATTNQTTTNQTTDNQSFWSRCTIL